MFSHLIKSKRTIRRWAVLPIGAIVFMIGALTFPLPIPTGLALMVTGIAIAAINPLVLRWFKRKRKRFPRANANIRRMTPHMPAFLQRILKRTDSHHC